MVSPILANIYLHTVLDVWFYETVQTHCRGQVYLCRYADDFVCAFEYEKDAQRFYEALEKRLNKFNLEVAENKTHLLVFSRCKIRNGLSFHFLGFEFRWGLNRRIKNRSRIPIIKRRTSAREVVCIIGKF